MTSSGEGKGWNFSVGGGGGGWTKRFVGGGGGGRRKEWSGKDTAPSRQKF